MKIDDQKLLGGLVLFGMVFALLVAALGGSCASAAPAAAQTSEAALSLLTPTLALARTGAREAGTRAYLRDDTAAIHAVVSFRSEHIYRTDYLTGLMRVTNGAPARTGAPRPWITQLMPSRQRPALFPGYLRWEGRHGLWWRRTYMQARDIMRGDIEHRCRVPGAPDDVVAIPHSWGSEHDSIRFRRENPDAIELDCGQTCTLDPDGSVRMTADGLPRCNRFFSLPRYVRRFGDV